MLKTYQAPVYKNRVVNILFIYLYLGNLRRLTMHIDSDLSVYLIYIMLLTFTTATLIITKYQKKQKRQGVEYIAHKPSFTEY